MRSGHRIGQPSVAFAPIAATQRASRSSGSGGGRRWCGKSVPTNPTNGLATVKVKADPAEADPADGSVGWVAVLSHGYFGISASDADLDVIGVDVKEIPLTRGRVSN